MVNRVGLVRQGLCPLQAPVLADQAWRFLGHPRQGEHALPCLQETQSERQKLALGRRASDGQKRGPDREA